MMVEELRVVRVASFAVLSILVATFFFVYYCIVSPQDGCCVVVTVSSFQSHS